MEVCRGPVLLNGIYIGAQNAMCAQLVTLLEQAKGRKDEDRGKTKTGGRKIGLRKGEWRGSKGTCVVSTHEQVNP